MSNIPTGLKLSVTTNAQEYVQNLIRYAKETGKEIGDALAREGPDFRQEVFRHFHQIHPTPLGSIFAAAKARGYRVNRKHSTDLVQSVGGVSRRALARARELLGGRKSDLFRFTGTAIEGFGIAPVRFSGRTGKMLQGGRTGWRFARSAVREYQLKPGQLHAMRQADTLRTFGLRRMNLRTLAVHYELLYRERAAQGGTMAVQWVFRTWRKGSRLKDRASQLVQRSNTGVPIGTVNFDFDRAGDLTGIVLRGYVPGTGRQAEKHNIVDSVFATRAPRLLRAIQLHHDKVARKLALAA